MNRCTAPLRSVLLTLLLASLAVPGQAAPPPDFQLEFVVGGFTRPITVRHSGDQTGRLFIIEQAGRIRIYDAPNDTLLATPFLNIVDLVDDLGNEKGLLGLAFHPDFKNNGYFYVNYTRDASPLDRTVIARYTVSETDPNIADPGSAVTLMEFQQDFSNHNGGNILFGPDGYLYIGMGDGGSGGDPNNRAQNLGTLLGKMLRIDVNGTPPPEPNDLCGLSRSNYSIPPDNPFVGGSGDCDEIWSYGWRNPWRFSFDRETGDLFVGDVGQNNIEEVDYQPATSTGGENWGWSCMEGNTPVNFNPCDGAPLSPPIFDYTHAGGNCSITGGYLYRGPVQSVRGHYWMGDYCSGRIWYATGAGVNWNFTEWQNSSFTISSFGEDESGNVYLTSFGSNAVYVFSLPAASGAGDVENLLVTKNQGDPNLLDLDWDPSCRSADSTYDVYEGLLGDWESHKPRTCDTGGTTETTLFPQGGSRYYLVAPRNSSREGSHGRNSFGLERPTGASNCLDQALAGCD